MCKTKSQVNLTRILYRLDAAEVASLGPVHHIDDHDEDYNNERHRNHKRKHICQVLQGEEGKKERESNCNHHY